MNIKLIIILSFLSFYIKAQSNANFLSKTQCFPVSQTGNVSYSLGLNVSKLPTQIVEEELNQAVMLSFSLKYGLPYNFAAHLNLSTIYITNDASLGLSWNYNYDNFGFALVNKIGYWYGQANFENFDSKADGIMYYPTVIVGYQYKNLFTSIGAGLDFMLTIRKFSGSIETKSSKNQLTGYNFFIMTEQPISKDNFISLGFKLHRTSYYYQSWIAFSNLEYKLWIPEIIIGYNL